MEDILHSFKPYQEKGSELGIALKTHIRLEEFIIGWLMPEPVGTVHHEFL